MEVKIKLLANFVGPSVNWRRGDVIDIDKETAMRMITDRLAIPVEAPAEKKVPRARKTAEQRTKK